MPNKNIFNLEPDELRSRIFGTDDAGDDQSLSVDSAGALQIRSISDAVSLESDVDIRNLTHASDSVLLYGYDGSSDQRIATDDGGNVKSIAEGRNFSETTTTAVPTGDNFANLDSEDVSERTTYSFFVHNTGSNDADVKLEISPDNSAFFTDVSTRTVAASDAEVIAPNRFLRYARISYKSTSTGSSTDIDVSYQAQV